MIKDSSNFISLMLIRGHPPRMIFRRAFYLRCPVI
jgi:hypothetical protein